MDASINIQDVLEKLYQLQKLDASLLEIGKKKKNLPPSLRKKQTLLKSFQEQSSQKKSEKAKFEKVFKQTQAALEVNQERIDRAQTKLNKVSSPKAFQAASKEMEQLKKQRKTLEEEQKKAQKQKEDLELILLEIEEKANLLEQDTQKESQGWEEKLLKIKEEEAVFLEKRTKYIQEISLSYLKKYDRIRKVRSGIGMVLLENHRCSACHMVLPPQLENEVIKAQHMHICPNCHRILMALPEEKSSEKQ